MSAPIVFWGASGHAKVLRECVERCGFRLVAVFDNDVNVPRPFPDVPMHIGESGFMKWLEVRPSRDVSGLVAIGGSRGRERLRIQNWMSKLGVNPLVAIHPTAFVAANAKLAPGCHVLGMAAVGVEAELGEATIVNTRASVDHECKLGCGVHIAPGATLAGCVTVEDFSLVGPGAVVLPRIRIGTNSIIGAGAVVTRDIPAGVVAYGNPARVIRPNLP